MDRRNFCYNLLAVPTALSIAPKLAHAATSIPGKVRIWDAARRIQFVLNDSLDHPFFWWPRTLLTYPIEFHQPVDLTHLILTNATNGERIPIQFSDVVQDSFGIRSATLNFFSDLPSGSHREFVLTVSKTPASSTPQVTEHPDGDSIILDSGTIRVRIPATQAIRGDAPGPVQQISRGGNWIGSSTLVIDGDNITRITTARVENGPLLIAYQLTYETASGAHYVARVDCAAGLDFIRLQEDMERLQPGSRGAFVCTWSGFNPTHRQSPNHPFPLPDELKPSYEDYGWETIDQFWTKPDVRFGSPLPIYPEVLPEGQLPIFIGTYEPAPGNTTIGPWANYWDQHSNDALGVFIDDASQWQDHEYAVEVESPTLQLSAHYRDGKLSWSWPLARGRRSTCITFYDHARDKEVMQEQERYTKPSQRDGLTYQVPISFTSHTLFLQNRYGTLNLNKVKDWVLDYPDDARRPKVIFNGGSVKTASELERRVLTTPFVCTLPVTGTRQMDGHGPIPGRSIVNFSPVPSRQIQGWWIDGFNRMNAQMTDRQRRRLTAMYLFIAYVLADEDFMPQVQMLSGHPNYFADVKATAPAMSFLFPDHSMARTWVDMWEKCLALNTRYNTRPAVKAWNADGGRWTEDLGTYVWAFVRPSLRSAFLLKKFDGVERFVTPQLAELAEWCVNALSAPFNGETREGFAALMKVDQGREWGVVGPGQGPKRVYPPSGAHSEQRMPPRALWYLGTCLHRYAPLAAEHAMWASRPTDQDAETAPGSEPPWDDIMYTLPDNRGTNPHLGSRKHTGYGVVLRAAVGTTNELSVHLQQIDQGPNYRWGWAGEGGCGLIYFYAAGKSYSFNASEDVGDRRDQDTDFCTNFGVFHKGVFRSIGENVLSRPFYNLGTGQFAEIVPREGPPHEPQFEYLSRSILLAGHDYFVVYDAVIDQSIVHRLSWFVRRGDELPTIQLVRGGGANDRETQRTDHQTSATVGVWFDGVGDSMAVVSHRKDITPQPTPFGCRVTAVGINDLVFRNQNPVQFADGQTIFNGTSGFIRTAPNKTDFALFHGTQIGVQGYVFAPENSDTGIGGSFVAGEPPSGDYYAPVPTSLKISSSSLRETSAFYIDGAAKSGRRESGSLVIDLDPGQHHWELSDSLPTPIAPHILRTENHSGGARVIIAPVASATRYRLELSKDDGATWSAEADHPEPSIDVIGVTNGTKVHVRAAALNSANTSAPGPEYPIYVSDQPPPTPDGLQVQLADGAATLTWGEVLGASEYRLYTRPKGERDFHLMYKGLERTYRDARAAIRAADPIPGQSKSAVGIVEYMIAAANSNGESPLSRPADTDPASWRTWDPKPGESFRRVYSYPQDIPQQPGERDRYYPA